MGSENPAGTLPDCTKMTMTQNLAYLNASRRGLTAMWSIYRQLKENRQILS